MIPKLFGVLDIESIPDPSLPEDQRPQFNESSVNIPKNWVDPFKIAKKIEDARIEFEAGIDKKMATDPDYCMVCCSVGILFKNGKPEMNMHTPMLSFSAVDEMQQYILIENAWNFVRNCYQEQIPLVTFNGLSFDLPVLIRRAMYSDIPIAPQMIANLMRRQDQNHFHYDLMQLLGLRSPFSGKVECKGLNYFLKRFGLGSKTAGMDGSMVYPMFKEGQHEEIMEYCKQDVIKTGELFVRVAPWLVAPSREAIDESAAKRTPPASISAAA